MTTSSELSTSEGFQSAVATSSDADRDFARQMSNRLIDVIKAFGAVKNRLHAQTNPDGVDFHLLMKLVRTGPMRAGDLAEQLCADPSTVSRQVAGLVKLGLLERQADPRDGRASILVPTDAAVSRVERMEAARGQLFAPLIADWTAEEREIFLRLLTGFAAALGENLEAVKNVASDHLGSDALTRRNA